MLLKRLLQPHYHRKLKKTLFVVMVVGTLFVAIVTTGLYGLSLLDSKLSLVKPGHEAVTYSRLVFAPAAGEYNLNNPQRSDFSRGQSKIIDNLLGGKEEGFFVEVGAGDGETNSVSLYFEKDRHWSGVLVEANEAKHRLSASKNRKAQLWNFRIRLDNEVTPEVKGDIRPDRLFQMINHTSIDLLIINLKGLEYEFVKNIDFAKYKIRVITIELQSDVSKELYMGVTDILTSRGYIVEHHLINTHAGKKDVVYMKS